MPTRPASPTAGRRNAHEQWLREITVLPTAAGREYRVIEWVERWVARRRDLKLRRDAAGNMIITTTTQRGRGRPIFLTAHLDHPAFVVRHVQGVRGGKTVELEFRGGVHDPYFDEAPIEIFDSAGDAHRAVITSLRPKAKPYKRVTAELRRAAATIAKGDVGRWAFRGRLPRVSRGMIHTNACDDLAAVAAALATLDLLRRRKLPAPVGVLLTRAEEVGFIGTLRVCKSRSVPISSRLICLENSRSFADSPIGGGPILRVGDKMSVFDPVLTNRIAALLELHVKKSPGFKWQRKLMPGGSCEATAFSAFGYESTCICLPLGNYHNMCDIDGVLAGLRPARVGPEYVSLADFHGMIEMLVVSVSQLDSNKTPSLKDRLSRLLKEHGDVLEG